MATLGFVGLGTMGGRMAKRLLDAGRRVVGYNRTPEKARALVAAGLTLEAGQLSFMVGGDPAALEKVRAHLQAIGPTITHVGELGLAVTMKIATNLGLAVQMLAFSEAVALAEKAGIERERAVEVLLKSVIASPMLKYRGPFVLGMPEDALFNVDMIQKDLGLALERGRALGVPLPTGALTDEPVTAARGLDLAHYDFAIVFDVIARMSGLGPSVKTQRA